MPQSILLDTGKLMPKCLVADNCHSSKRHKFVNIILDWTLIILNLKWSKSKTKNYFIELEIDLFFLIFNSKQNIFIMKWK